MLADRRRPSPGAFAMPIYSHRVVPGAIKNVAKIPASPFAHSPILRRPPLHHRVSDRRTSPDLRLWALCFAGVAQPWSKAGLSIGAGLLLLATLWERRHVGTFRTGIGKATGAFLLVLLVSTLTSSNMSQGWDNFFGFWPLTYMFLGAAAVRDARKPQLYLWTFVASTLAASSVGIHHIVMAYIDKGFFNGTAEVPTNIWLFTLALGGGTIGALTLMRGKSNKIKILLVLAALSQLLAVFATRRRISLFILALILAAMIPYYLRRSKLALVALVGLIGIGTYMLSSDLRVKRLTSVEDFLAGEKTRAALWTIGWETFEKEPLLGTGLGDFRDDLRAVKKAEGKTRFAGANLNHYHCHNNFLHTMATSGVLGLLAFLVWIFLIPVWVFRHRKRNPDAAFLAFAAWFMLFGAGLTDAPLYSSSRLSAFTLLFGYAWGMLLRNPDVGQTVLDEPTPESDNHAAIT